MRYGSVFQVTKLKPKVQMEAQKLVCELHKCV